MTRDDNFDSEACKTVQELFAETLIGDYDDDLPWHGVRTLHRRGSLEVFRIAAGLCVPTNPLERARGFDVLGQLGYEIPVAERTYSDPSVSIAISGLSDTDPRVRSFAAYALVHLASDAAVAALIDAGQDSDAGVRTAVAMGLARSATPETIPSVIELTQDVDEDVRDWATFSLGTRCEASPQVRDALQARLTDSNPCVSDKAIWRLARRRDPGVARMLLDRLESEDGVRADEDAAAELLGWADRRIRIFDLCTGLRELSKDY